jgi:diguanylate cyclase (GGDEF)-like protein
MDPRDEMTGVRRVRAFWERFGDPMAYSVAERALLASGIMVTGVLLFALMVLWGQGWPYLPPTMDPQTMSIVGKLGAFWVVPWTALILLALWLRTRAPDARLIAYLVSILYAFTIGMFAYLTGPLYAPGWIASIGGGVLGLLLFGRSPTVVACIVFLVVVSASIWGQHAGFLPQLTPHDNPMLAEGWAIRMGICSFSYAGLTLLLAGYIITRWRDRERKLDIASRTDALTGVTNRRHFMETFERELKRAQRYKIPLSVVLIDVDHFKKVNDTYGHLVGDEVLRAVARALEKELREHDVLARYGGEEFAILLPNTGSEGAIALANRCRETIAQTAVKDVQVTASFGAATYPDTQAHRIEDLVGSADAALYQSKSEGRNRVSYAG